jgi:hypothetical protein
MQTAAITPSTAPQEVPLSLLIESATNPRQHFEDDDLIEKAETIRKSGIYQAILARLEDDRLEFVFGARRYRASQLAGKETIPALVREMSDGEVLEAQLIGSSIVGKSFLCLLCDLGTSFICNRRAGLTPNCWIQRNAAASCNGMRSLIADSIHW